MILTSIKYLRNSSLVVRQQSSNVSEIRRRYWHLENWTSIVRRSLLANLILFYQMYGLGKRARQGRHQRVIRWCLFLCWKRKSRRCLLFWRAFFAVMRTRCWSIPCCRRWKSFSLSSRDWGVKTFLETEWTESTAIDGRVRMHSSVRWLLPWKNRRTILTPRVMKECSSVDDDERVCS